MVRHGLGYVGVATALNFVIFGTATYRGVEYMGSTTFYNWEDVYCGRSVTGLAPGPGRGAFCPPAASPASKESGSE
jgi:hypothetical protein